MGLAGIICGLSWAMESQGWTRFCWPRLLDAGAGKGFAALASSIRRVEAVDGKALRGSKISSNRTGRAVPGFGLHHRFVLPGAGISEPASRLFAA
jgi:hypothetical protein